MQVMERTLAQRTPRRLYQRRKTIVEPAFGMIQSARGIDRFGRRGIDAGRHDGDSPLPLTTCSRSGATSPRSAEKHETPAHHPDHDPGR
jgi:hypothetical protein